MPRVSFVLLIACANFRQPAAGTRWPRATTRVCDSRRCSSLGRWQFDAAKLLTESLLLCHCRWRGGGLLAFWGTKLLVSFKPENLPRLSEIGVDGRVLGFTLGISILTGLIFGLVPAWAASRGRVGDALKEGGRSATPEARDNDCAARLSCRTCSRAGAARRRRSAHQDFLETAFGRAGFNPDHLITMRVELPETRYKEVRRKRAFANRSGRHELTAGRAGRDGQ
jgi:hypothetical protein